MKKTLSLYERLTEEISHHPIFGLLAITVLLIHVWVVLKLLEPIREDKAPQHFKIMEVALISEVKPKLETPPPAPPKKEPPKKKAVEPPVKKKSPVIHKEGEIPKPKLVTKDLPPALPSFTPPKKETPFTGTPSLANKSAPKPAANSGSGHSQGVSSGVVELGCPKPKYPARAMSRHIEGWVKVEMTVGVDGRVTNARVAGSEPAGIFDGAALDAVKNCRFKPRMVNGKAVEQRAVKKSTFKLTN